MNRIRFAQNTYRASGSCCKGFISRASGSCHEGSASGASDSIYENFTFEGTQDVRRLHMMLPVYEPTPLVNLKGLAEKLGVKAILVKDESSRFGLKAFKGLGGIYAMFRIICRELDLDPAKTNLSMLQQSPFREQISQMTFATTTDGNHGKGVSWAAGIMGCKAYVYMPRGTVEVRAQAIRDAGNAEVTITDMLYDECVAWTSEQAKANGWHLIQDTSDDEYDQVPLWIMQGYTTLYFESLEQMRSMGYTQPTHIFLQAGVGSMAGAVAAAAVDVEAMTGAVAAAAVDEWAVAGAVAAAAVDAEALTGTVADAAAVTGSVGKYLSAGTDNSVKNCLSDSMKEGSSVIAAAESDKVVCDKLAAPVIATVEPDEVACFYESFLADDGLPHRSQGSNETIMAGLNCAIPCTPAWNILKNVSIGGFACPDEITRQGMCHLAKPCDGDTAIISGESGAVTLGLTEELLKDPEYVNLREQLGIGPDSVIFLISTEGDTDPENYRKITGCNE